MVHIVIWLVVGAVIGLVAGSLMRGNDDQSVRSEEHTSELQSP